MVNNFDLRSGGHTVQYEFARLLSEKLGNVKVRAPLSIKNPIFNNYLENDYIDRENTVVIYAENIVGNPINAKYVIRWILAPIGINSPNNRYTTWGKHDLVYYFNYEDKFNINPSKIGVIYKLLNIFFINPSLRKINTNPRDGWCYTTRKTQYHKRLTYVHPPNAYEVTREHSQSDYIEIFNTYKYFISYDPVTFLSVIAALCGCISIVKKIDGLSKQQWLYQTPFSQYLQELNISELYGIEYGKEDLENAINTIHLAKEQWDTIGEYMKNKNVNYFINEINSIGSNIPMINTIYNNYIQI